MADAPDLSPCCQSHSIQHCDKPCGWRICGNCNRRYDYKNRYIPGPTKGQQ